MIYVDPAIPLEETHPMAAELLAEECQRRGKLINEAIAAGEPIPDFKPIVFRAKPKQFKSDESKVGRNEPCPCGSNKKYKKCCGR